MTTNTDFNQPALKQHVTLYHNFKPVSMPIEEVTGAQLVLNRDRQTSIHHHTVECDTSDWAPDVTITAFQGMYLQTINQIHLFHYRANNPEFQGVLDSLALLETLYHELRHAYNASCFYHANGPWNYQTFILDEIMARVSEYIAGAIKMPMPDIKTTIDIDVNYNVGLRKRHMVTRALEYALDILDGNQKYMGYWADFDRLKGQRFLKALKPLPENAVWMKMRLMSINNRVIDIYEYIPHSLFRRMEKFLNTTPDILRQQIDNSRQR